MMAIRAALADAAAAATALCLKMLVVEDGSVGPLTWQLDFIPVCGGRGVNDRSTLFTASWPQKKVLPANTRHSTW